MSQTSLLWAGKWSEKKKLFEVKEFSFESVKIDILKKSLEIFNYNNADFLKKNEILVEGQSE